MQHHHHHRQRGAQQGEGVEQAQVAAGVAGTHELIDFQRHALQQVAEDQPEEGGGDQAAGDDAAVPPATPLGVLELGAIVKAQRAEEQREQDGQHREIEAGEHGAVDHRPHREHRTDGRDQPHLIAIPVRGQSVDHHAALAVIAADQRHQHRRAHVHAIGDDEADQQQPYRHPPEQLEDLVIPHDPLLLE